MDIDTKLNTYRARKKKEKQFEKTKKVLYNLATLQLIARKNTVIPSNSEEMAEETLVDNECRPSASDENFHEDEKQKRIFKHLMRINYFLYILLWIALFIIAIEFEFGIVFLILSSLFFIWFNTRTGPKKTGEVSAYSVFNPNCEAIDGTLNAEQFESELRYGALSVH